ncbi:PAS domain S-box-containing protein [Desulfobotulus alkaliphilus]|uniref:Sensory/regulatory protein RpfC n=1 Tax=Desulfobotulus alkaliphilus TaxID=622671 RepID=A0A562RYL5_9BACT|nr:PAS domain S-box protein [Desulfobotulus alkaliphilus]TWI74207.1 PAS domain S-box-containing protein [Desulfobotulus alkaliphilus]
MKKTRIKTLLPVIFFLLFLLVLSGAGLFWQQQKDSLNEKTSMNAKALAELFHQSLEIQADGLRAAARIIAMDKGVHMAMKAEDGVKLLSDWREPGAILSEENGITHFYFWNAKRESLVRIYNPDKRGGMNKRYTARQSEKSGKAVSGLELGSLGTFTLRVVQPVFSRGELLGYVELGKEIEDILKALHRDSATTEIAVSIWKSALNREAWERGMELLKREADWDRLPHSALIYASMGRLPDIFNGFADHNPAEGHAHKRTDEEVFSGDKSWRVTVLGLEEASGREVGDLLILKDITAMKAAFRNTMVWGAMVAVFLLAALLGLLIFMLRRTEKRLFSQQTALIQSEEKFRHITESIGDVVWLRSHDNSAILYVSPAYETLWGRNCQSLYENPQGFMEAVHPLDKNAVCSAFELYASSGRFDMEYRILRPDGSLRWVHARAFPVRGEDGSLLHHAGIATDITAKKLTEQQKEEFHERLLTVLDAMDALIYIADMESYELLFLNAFGRRAFGEVDGRRCWEVLQSGQKGPCTFCTNSRLLRSDGTATGIHHWEFLNTANDRWYDCRDQAIPWAGGRMVRMEVAIDITERRQAEEESRRMLSLLDSILDSLEEGILVVDGKGGISRLNRAFFDLWRIPPDIAGAGEESLLNYALSQLADPDTFLAKVKHLYKSPEASSFDEIHFSDGRVFDRYSQPQWQGSQVIGRVWCFRDITARKKAENELRRLSRAVEQSPASIIITDLEGTIDYVNPAFTKVTGYSFEEIKGQNPRILKSPDRPSEAYREMWDILSSGGEWRGEFKNIRKNGELFWEAASITPIFNEKGEPTHYLAVKEDITERKRAEEALLESNRQLETAITHASEMALKAQAAANAKGEFLANMSHEIRTPMNGVMGLTSLLLDTKLDASQRRFAETIYSSARSLLGIINDILDFSKVEAGKLDLEILAFDLEKLMEDFSSAMVTRAEEKGLGWQTAIDPDVPRLLRGDPGRLRQILTNLAGNALKFTEKGEVQVRVALEDKDGHGVRLRFEVEDTGMGIPEDRIPLLFDKFSQVDASMTRRFGGTGLGLAISRQLAGLMGGEIGVESLAGKGSTFWFTVRFGLLTEGEQDRLQTRERRHSLSELPSLSGRILLAEDNSINQEVALGILSKFGLHTDTVANGLEALEAVKSLPYDLILMDVMMPEMDGLEAARRIRKMETEEGGHGGGLTPSAKGRIPIIAMTAGAMQQDRDRCLEAGMDDFVPKPVEPEGLAEVLGKWLAIQKNGDKEKKGSSTSLPEDGRGTFAEAEAPPLRSSGQGAMVFDSSDLMKRLTEDEDLFRTVLRLSLEVIPQHMEALRLSLKSHDSKSVRWQAHTLKGMAANISANAFSELAGEMEDAAASENLIAVEEKMEAFVRSYENLREVLEDFLGDDLSGASEKGRP